MLPAEATVMSRHSASQTQITQHQRLQWTLGYHLYRPGTGVCGPGKLPEAALIAAPYVPLCLFRNLSCVRGVPTSVSSALSLMSGMKRSKACHRH